MSRLAPDARPARAAGRPVTGAPRREVVTACVVASVASAGVVTATEALSLPVAVVIATVLVCGVGVAVVRHGGAESCAVALLAGATAAAPANAVSVGGLPPGPALLAVALAGLTCVTVWERRPVRVPAWVWPLPVAVVVVSALHLLAPTDLSYLAGRHLDGVVLSDDDLAFADYAGALNAAQWLVSALALPVAVCMATARRPGLPPTLVTTWALGSTLSAAVALTDSWGVTTVSESLLGTVDVGGRQAGLTVQPNHLAVTAALGLTVVLWRMLRSSSAAAGLAWAGAGLVLIGGLIVSESRGGLVVGLLSAVVVLGADRRARGLLPALAGLAVAALVVAVSLVGRLLDGLLERLRFSGAGTAAESDAIREAIADQAVRDFLREPVRGIGIEVIVQGHNIYLELLAAGGVLLLAGFAATAVGALLEARALRERTATLSALLGLCVLTWLVGGLVENQVTDLYLYVPLALLAGLHAVARTRTDADSCPPEQMGHHAR